MAKREEFSVVCDSCRGSTFELAVTAASWQAARKQVIVYMRANTHVTQARGWLTASLEGKVRGEVDAAFEVLGSDEALSLGCQHLLSNAQALRGGGGRSSQPNQPLPPRGARITHMHHLNEIKRAMLASLLKASREQAFAASPRPNTVAYLAPECSAQGAQVIVRYNHLSTTPLVAELVLTHVTEGVENRPDYVWATEYQAHLTAANRLGKFTTKRVQRLNPATVVSTRAPNGMAAWRQITARAAPMLASVWAALREDQQVARCESIRLSMAPSRYEVLAALSTDGTHTGKHVTGLARLDESLATAGWALSPLAKYAAAAMVAALYEAIVLTPMRESEQTAESEFKALNALDLATRLWDMCRVELKAMANKVSK